jgi:hypothetical protein
MERNVEIIGLFFNPISYQLVTNYIYRIDLVIMRIYFMMDMAIFASSIYIEIVLLFIKIFESDKACLLLRYLSVIAVMI